jgi:hypothetical protein
LLLQEQKRAKTNAKVAEVRTTVLGKIKKVEALRNELFSGQYSIIKKKGSKTNESTTVSPKMTIVV